MPVAEPIRHAEALSNKRLPSSVAMRRVPYSKIPTGEKCQNGAETGTVERNLFAVPLIVAGGTVLAVAVLLSQSSGYKICLMKKTPGCGCTATGRRAARNFDGTGARGLYRLSLADKPALAPGFAAGLAANISAPGFSARSLAD